MVQANSDKSGDLVNTYVKENKVTLVPACRSTAINLSSDPSILELDHVTEGLIDRFTVRSNFTLDWICML